MSAVSECESIMRETLGSLTQDMDPEECVQLYDACIKMCQDYKAEVLEESEE